MIGYISGKVKFKYTDAVVVDVGGVGYQIYVPASTLSKLSLNQNAELFIHTHVREENLDLYGFRTQEELALFKLLLSVSGIGPRTALLVVDKGTEQVKQAIVKADTGFFTLIPRLGTKNAQKIIIELKSKLGGLGELDLSSIQDSETTEAIEALINMGYTRQEAIQAMRNIPTSVTTTEEKIRYALKSSVKK
jgi:Holliday junction DNA helicase RuvA